MPLNAPKNTHFQHLAQTIAPANCNCTYSTVCVCVYLLCAASFLAPARIYQMIECFLWYMGKAEMEEQFKYSGSQQQLPAFRRANYVKLTLKMAQLQFKDALESDREWVYTFDSKWVFL